MPRLSQFAAVLTIPKHRPVFRASEQAAMIVFCLRQRGRTRKSQRCFFGSAARHRGQRQSSPPARWPHPTMASDRRKGGRAENHAQPRSSATGCVNVLNRLVVFRYRPEWCSGFFSPPHPSGQQAMAAQHASAKRGSVAAMVAVHPNVGQRRAALRLVSARRASRVGVFPRKSSSHDPIRPICRRGAG